MYDLLVVVLDENQHRRVSGAEFPVKSLETGPVFVCAVGQLPRVSDCTRRQLFCDLREVVLLLIKHTRLPESGQVFILQSCMTLAMH